MISYLVASLVLGQDGPKPRPVPKLPPLVPRMIDVQREKSGWYSIYVVFPMFPEASPVAQLANSEAENFASTLLADFQKELQDLLKKPKIPYHIKLKPRISLTNSNIISYDYKGDIEDGQGKSRLVCRTVNIAMVDGKPRVLKLADLFNPRDLASVKAMMADQAKMIYRYSPTSEDMNKFLFSKASLCWLIPDRVRKGEYKTLKFDWKYIKPMVKSQSVIDGINSF